MTRKAKPVPMGVGTGSGNKGKAGSAPYSPPKPHRKPPGHGIAIARIKVGHRHRRDLGDIAALAANIDDIGLLHPVVLRRDRTLIAGARRIAAATKLGWKTIPATVIDLDDILRGEFAENAYRKNLTLSEAVAIADALEALERKAAKARQAAAGPASGRGKKATASVNFTEPVRGQALDKVAKALGMSRARRCNGREPSSPWPRPIPRLPIFRRPWTRAARSTRLSVASTSRCRLTLSEMKCSFPATAHGPEGRQQGGEAAYLRDRKAERLGG